MTTYILKRLLVMIPTMFGIILISFVVIHLAPGDPAAQKFGGIGQAASGIDAQRGTEAAEKQFRERYHLDKPIYVQFGYFLKRLATFDMKLYQQEKELWPELKERILVTVQINLIVFVLIYLIAIPSGVMSAAFPHSVGDRATTLILFMLYSLPSFFAAELLRIYLCDPDRLAHPFPTMGLFSSDPGEPGSWEYFVDWLHHVTLPIICLTYGGLAYISRQMRVGMLEVIRQDYIRTAEAKGAGKARVILVHALRNGLFPVITIFASLLPFLVGGSVIIEVIFNIPGMGIYAYEAVLRREYDVVMTTLILSAVLTLVGVLISDILYVLVNPRVSFETQG